MHWDVLQKSASIIRDLGVGIGTFLGGYAALPFVKDRWKADRIKKKYKAKYIERFSAWKRDKNNAYIWKREGSDGIYAIYTPNNTKQHIKHWSTFIDLGYGSGDWDKEVSKKELENYQDDEPIDFS